MNKYLSFFRLRFVNSLQYRSAAFAGIATQFFWGLMELLLFSAFYRAGDTAEGKGGEDPFRCYGFPQCNPFVC